MTRASQFNLLDSWSVAVSWIVNCSVNHQRCSRTPLQTDPKPSRVISVGYENDFSDIKVCLARNLPSNFSYVTLSHCWGPIDLSLKLTRLLESDFQEQIPWDPLPLTFRNAIMFTRRLNAALGIQYIWIDALCIVQDSKEDWMKEATNMANIYRYSFCNLAASVGPDSRFGLFWESDPYAAHICVIEAKINGIKSGFFDVHNYESYETDVKNSVLESRAWVLQEVLLAPRIIYFTPHQWIWECSQICASHRAPTQNLIGDRRQFFNTGACSVTQTGSKTELEFSLHSDYELYRIWMNSVNAFTSRNLTQPRDKLVAISGLAKDIHARFISKDKYIVGLWRCHLLLHMLWKVSHGKITSRPQPYRAPTWSWASVEGTIYNHRTTLETVNQHSPLAEILFLDIKYVSEDEFCEVESAEAVMKGLVFEVELEFLGLPLNQLLDLAKIKWQGRILTADGHNVANLDIEPSINTKPTAVFCMPLVALDTNDPDSSEAGCLLLEPVTGRNGVYERIGRSDLSKHRRRVLTEAKATKLPETRFVEYHGEGVYTVVLI